MSLTETRQGSYFGDSSHSHQLAAPEAVEAIPELEFDQTANLTAEVGHLRLVAEAGADAEPIPDLEFDQTLGW